MRPALAMCCLAAAAATAPSPTAPPAPQLPFPWPGWDHIATSTWGSNSSCCAASAFTNLSCCSGLDSQSEALYKTQFDLVFLDNGIGTPGCRFLFDNGSDTMRDCHRHRSEGAALIKSIAPSKPVFSALFDCVSVDFPSISSILSTIYPHFLSG